MTQTNTSRRFLQQMKLKSDEISLALDQESARMERVEVRLRERILVCTDIVDSFSGFFKFPKEAIINGNTREGWTPLHIVSHFESFQTQHFKLTATEFAVELLKYPRVRDNIDQRTAETKPVNWTALRLAVSGNDCMEERLRLVSKLIGAGASLNELSGRIGSESTALHAAAGVGAVRMCKLLLHSRALVNIESTKGYTPLDFCPLSNVTLHNLLWHYDARSGHAPLTQEGVPDRGPECNDRLRGLGTSEKRARRNKEYWEQQRSTEHRWTTGPTPPGLDPPAAAGPTTPYSPAAAGPTPPGLDPPAAAWLTPPACPPQLWSESSSSWGAGDSSAPESSVRAASSSWGASSLSASASSTSWCRIAESRHPRMWTTSPPSRIRTNVQ